MKIAIIPNDLTQDLEKVFQLCNKEGVKYVELASMWGKSILDLTPEEDQKVEDLLKKYQIQVASIQTQIMKVHSPISEKSQSNGKMHDDYEFNIGKIDRAIELAKRFNAKYIISYSFMDKKNHTDEEREKNWDLMHQSYAKFLPKLKEAGVTMCIEGDGGQYCGTVEEHLRLFEHFNSPHIAANFDMANMYHVQEFHREDFEQFQKWVPYFHVKDRKIRTGWKKILFGGTKPALTGEGNIPWRKVLPWFAEIGFDGFLSVEPHIGGNRFENGRKCVQNLQKILQDLGIDYE